MGALGRKERVQAQETKKRGRGKRENKTGSLCKTTEVYQILQALVQKKRAPAGVYEKKKVGGFRQGPTRGRGREGTRKGKFDCASQKRIKTRGATRKKNNRPNAWGAGGGQPQASTEKKNGK